MNQPRSYLEKLENNGKLMCRDNFHLKKLEESNNSDAKFQRTKTNPMPNWSSSIK